MLMAIWCWVKTVDRARASGPSSPHFRLGVGSTSRGGPPRAIHAVSTDSARRPDRSVGADARAQNPALFKPLQFHFEPVDLFDEFTPLTLELLAVHPAPPSKNAHRLSRARRFQADTCVGCTPCSEASPLRGRCSRRASRATRVSSSARCRRRRRTPAFLLLVVRSLLYLSHPSELLSSCLAKPSA